MAAAAQLAHAPEGASVRPGVRLRLFCAWLIYVAAVWVVAVIAAPRMLPLMTGVESTAVNALSAWDGQNYAAIADEGYVSDGYAARRVAFFPLMPAVTRVLAGPANVALAGILLAQVSLLGVLLLLASFSDPGDPRLRAQPGFWLLVQPIGFFLAAFYAEAPFLLLAIGGWLAWCRRRHRLAASLLLLAGLTRPTAILLPALFATELLDADSERRRPAALCAVAPLAGIALHLALIGLRFGEPLAYVHIQHELWRHEWTLPFVPLARVVAAILGGRSRPDVDLELVACYALASVALLMARRLERPYVDFVIAGLLFFHMQEPIASSPRYTMALFPLYIAMARTEVARGAAGPVIAVASLAVQFGFLLRFLAWDWVA